MRTNDVCNLKSIVEQREYESSLNCAVKTPLSTDRLRRRQIVGAMCAARCLSSHVEIGSNSYDLAGVLSQPGNLCHCRQLERASIG